MAATQPTMPTDAPPAAQLLELLQRGGTKSNYLTFDADGHAHTTWYDSGTAPPAPPAGTNVYFGVNPCTAIPATNAAGKLAKPAHVRGRADHIAALNCLYAEYDAKDFGGSLDATLAHVRGLEVPPSVIVASGNGYHCYWLLDEPFVLDTGEARARAIDVQARWVTFVGGDKAAKDIARVLRVPGTLNYKYEPPRPVAFVEQDDSQLYTLDELQAALPVVPPRKARTPKQNAAARHTDGLQPDGAQPSVDWIAVSKAAAALARLRVERRDEYTDWLNVGMALRELGTIGYHMWEAWSMASPKFTVGECQRKWDTFRIGVPGSDITLGSLFRWADEDAGEFKHETGGELDENERRQLQAYKARDIQQQGILNMDAPLAAKAAWLGMVPSLEAASILVENKDGHSGSVSVDYGNFAAIMKTSDTTIGRYIDMAEQAGLWRKDAEYKETKAGYDVKVVRLDLQPAFYRPELAQPIEQKPRGGPRAGAGRKPKCPKHPTAAIREEVTTVTTQYCAECGDILHHTTHQVTRTMAEDALAAPQFKHETGDAPDAHAGQLEQTAEIKHETGYTDGPTPVSCLKRPLDDILVETVDMATVVPHADTHAPADEHGRAASPTEPIPKQAAAANVLSLAGYAT